MKKKIFYILLLIVFTFYVTGCSSNAKLNSIAKNINNSESVKNYNAYGYEIKASATKDSLIISSNMGGEKNEVSFQLEGDILSNTDLSINDLMLTLYVINGVGQTYGYKDGEMSQNINAFPEEYQKYSLNKEGLELVIGDENVSFKIDLSKKIPLIDMKKFYLTPDSLDIIRGFIEEHKYGNQSGKSGNIAYDVFAGDEESTILIGQDGALSNSAYQSILSALEVMYGKDVSDYFQKLYPNFVDGKSVVDYFTVEANYEIDVEEHPIFKDTEVVFVTIDNKKINS